MGSRLQPRYIRSQPLQLLQLLLFIALRVGVVGGVVVRTPLLLTTAAAAFHSLLPVLFPCRALLRPFRAIALKMPVFLTLMTLVSAGRRHRGSTARDHGPRSISRPLIDVEAGGSLLEFVHRGELIAVMHFTDKFKLRGLCEAREHDVQEDVFGDVLPQ